VVPLVRAAPGRPGTRPGDPSNGRDNGHSTAKICPLEPRCRGANLPCREAGRGRFSAKWAGPIGADGRGSNAGQMGPAPGVHRPRRHQGPAGALAAWSTRTSGRQKRTREDGPPEAGPQSRSRMKHLKQGGWTRPPQVGHRTTRVGSNGESGKAVGGFAGWGDSPRSFASRCCWRISRQASAISSGLGSMPESY